MRRALNQRSKGVWLLHVDESNFGRCKRRFRGKASRVSHACDDWHRRGTQEAQNITARLPACTDEKNRIPDARCTHRAMIERLWRVRDPMRPRPIDVGVAGDAPLRAAMGTCRHSGKSNVRREIPFLSRGLSSTQRRHPPALAISSNVRILETPVEAQCGCSWPRSDSHSTDASRALSGPPDLHKAFVIRLRRRADLLRSTDE